MPGTVRKLAGHLNVAITEDEVARIVEHCCFTNMKNNREVNATWQEEFRAVDKQFGGHIRKGTYSNNFTAYSHTGFSLVFKDVFIYFFINNTFKANIPISIAGEILV